MRAVLNNESAQDGRDGVFSVFQDNVVRPLLTIQVADDIAAVTGQLVKLMGDYKIGGKQVHDANIVATMQAYGIPALLTHNTKDFERFGKMIRIEGI